MTGARRPRMAAWLLGVLLLAACAAPPAGAPPPPAAPVHLTLLQVNDVYSLEPVDGGRRGGLARLAALVKETRAENANTLFAVAGDFISPSPISTMLRGVPMIAAFNAAGLDAATFGNHEFDYGPEVLRRRMQESRFAWLSENVVDRRTGRPFGGAAAELLVTLGGVPVGLFGVTTPESAATSAPGADVIFRDPLPAAREASAALRRRGARLVVALTHQHMAADRALATDRAADIDVILGGHEHQPLVAEEGKTLITKAGSEARYLVRIDLWLTPDGGLLERSWQFREVGARIAPDPAVAALVADYQAQLGRELDVVIGRTAVALEARRQRLRTEESNAADFIADVMRARMRADAALFNGGAIRTDRVVPPGPLTKRDVNMLLPFTNIVMTLEVSGARLREALEQGLAQVEHEGGGFLQVSGVRLVWDARRPAGARLVSAAVGDAPLDPSRAYTVATIDYLVRGGDGVTAFHDARVLVNEASGPPLAELVLGAIAQQGTIAPAADGRIQRRGD